MEICVILIYVLGIFEARDSQILLHQRGQFLDSGPVVYYK